MKSNQSIEVPLQSKDVSLFKLDASQPYSPPVLLLICDTHSGYPPLPPTHTHRLDAWVTRPKGPQTESLLTFSNPMNCAVRNLIFSTTTDQSNENILLVGDQSLLSFSFSYFGLTTLPWNRSTPVFRSLKKNTKGWLALNWTIGSLDADLKRLTTAALADAAFVPSSPTSISAFWITWMWWAVRSKT